jgi:hypothetical protein
VEHRAPPGSTINSALGLIARHSGGTEAGEKARRRARIYRTSSPPIGADGEIALIFG